MLTAQKRKYALALMSGMSKRCGNKGWVFGEIRALQGVAAC